MKEQFDKLKEQIKSLWINSKRGQKIIFFATIAIVLILVIGLAVYSTSDRLVPLYKNLALEEVGQIKEELESQNITYEISDGGTTIKVPESEKEQLLVDLAGKQIPTTGNIDYSFFSENASWGVTDNEFNMMKLDAMQTELANLIRSIDGIEDAEVMINLPQQSIFVNEFSEEASAAIVLHTAFGYEFERNKIESLYHLVAKAVPNLPPENIVIRNQYLEYFDLAQSTQEDHYTYQQKIKRDTEQDIQKRLQQMLGMMVGMDKVFVSVTADIDYTEENRQEELVEPVDIDNIEGIPVSIENIRETFEGADGEVGVVGVGDEDIPNYPAGFQGQDGDYELVKDTVNYEMNRIYREITESPYKVRNLGVQVVIDSVVERDGEDVQLLTQQEETTVEEGIASILNSVIATSIDEQFADIDPEENISIVFQPFNEQTELTPTFTRSIPLWVYIVGALLLLAVIVLAFLLFRRRKEKEEAAAEPMTEELEEDYEIPDIMSQPKSEAELQREQLEKMAKDKPEDFAKLLRGWLADD